MNRLAKWIMRLYPAAWRARYGDELDALLGDSGSDARVVADLLQEGIRMRISMWSFSKLAPVLAIGGMLAGFGVSFLVTPVYVSTATMRITSAGIDSPASEIIMKTDTAALSRTSLSAIIQDPRLQLYGAERRNTPLEDVIEKMKRNISVRFVRTPANSATHSTAFDISFFYYDGWKAHETIRRLMDRFAEENQAMQRHQAGKPESGGDLDVLATASVPTAAKPNRYVCGAMGLICGLFAAIIITIIRRMRRQPLAMSQLAPTA